MFIIFSIVNRNNFSSSSYSLIMSLPESYSQRKMVFTTFSPLSLTNSAQVIATYLHDLLLMLPTRIHFSTFLDSSLYFHRKQINTLSNRGADKDLSILEYFIEVEWKFCDFWKMLNMHKYSQWWILDTFNNKWIVILINYKNSIDFIFMHVILISTATI